MSDLVTCYGPQAMRFTCLVLVPFEHEVYKSDGKQTKKEELRKNNRNICITSISNLANGATITFETYN
jgi:hypothetical protein